MRLPLSWLRDFVDYSGDPETLADRLGTSGFEIEAILRRGAPDVGDNHCFFVIGRVAHFDKHPNADRLRLCQVDTGDAEPRQIVCGASNFAIGDTVVVALPGARLPGADAPLKRTKLRGEVSNGMMLSERELGLSEDHDGIIVLPGQAGFDVGSLLRDHIALDEVVLDVSVESNRGDCLSVYGMAREVAVLFDLDLAPMPGSEPPTGRGGTSDLVTVSIDAPDRCSRFAARGFIDVTVGPAPFRVRQRLAAAGIRPISNVVDVSNYVMHELGNPLHVYDANHIAGRVLTARLALAGETIRTLDNRERALTDDVLVIADDEGPSAIAGVMGGLSSEVTDATSRVVLEAACFERGGIQRTSKALGLRTDGSNRWEKGVSPHLAPYAAVRAAELICAWSGATLLGDPQDVVTRTAEAESVHLRADRPAEVLGLEIPAERVERILTGLGYAPERSGNGWACTVPWWRWLDATREIDLIEEIGRVHGLARVPAVLPRVPPGIGSLTSGQRIRRRVEDHLAGAGLREVVTLSLVDPDDRVRHGFGDQTPVELRNPLSADLSELRVSLLPSLLGVVRRNHSVGARDVQIFEIGRVHALSGLDGPVVASTRLGIVLAGRIGGVSWLGDAPPADFGSAIACLDALMARVGVAVGRERLVDHPLLHPGRSARVVLGSDVIGVVGEIHPSRALEMEFDVPIALIDLDLDKLEAAVPNQARVVEISPFPPVRQDIAVVVSDDVDAATVVRTILEAGGELLVDVGIFDVFEDPDRLGIGRVSLAIHLVVQAIDRTLTDEDATKVRERIVAALAERHGAELRG